MSANVDLQRQKRRDRANPSLDAFIKVMNAAKEVRNMEITPLFTKAVILMMMRVRFVCFSDGITCMYHEF